MIKDKPNKKKNIPLVDDGVTDVKRDNTYDNLQNFYSRCHVGEYLHTTEKGKCLKFEFGNMLKGYEGGEDDDAGENKIVRKLSTIEINKKSFMNNMNTVARYVNYFIEYFDEDDELMMTYFEMMFQIMNSSVDLDPQTFVENIRDYFGTESMIEKIVAMVEYNTDENLMKTSDRAYDESIQLTAEHLKAIMGMSCLHKFVIPIVSHYLNVKKKDLENAGWSDKDLYFYVFSQFVSAFDDIYDIALYDKLYHTATTRISKTSTQESTMWKRRMRLGITPTSYANQLMKDLLIDISQKMVFNRSAIIFIHVCFDRAIKNELMQPDRFEFTDMKMEASDSVNETISRFDRWQAEKTSHSQRDRLRAMVSIKDSLNRQGREFGLDFEALDDPKKRNSRKYKELREEYEYYRENLPLPLNEAQQYIVYLYYAARLGSTEDAKQLEASDMFKLVMIMKKDFAMRNYTYLQFFISGRLDITANRKYNKRKVEKLMKTHPCYEDWYAMYKDSCELINMDRIYNILKIVLSCPIRVVDYEHPDIVGKLMNPIDICVVDEFIRFVLEL